MRTLHDLTHEEGHDRVAESMGITPRTLTSKRAGASPLTVDDLYALLEAWPDFDAPGTIRMIGGRRARRTD